MLRRVIWLQHSIFAIWRNHFRSYLMYMGLMILGKLKNVQQND